MGGAADTFQKMQRAINNGYLLWLVVDVPPHNVETLTPQKHAVVAYEYDDAGILIYDPARHQYAKIPVHGEVWTRCIAYIFLHRVDEKKEMREEVEKAENRIRLVNEAAAYELDKKLQVDEALAAVRLKLKNMVEEHAQLIEQSEEQRKARAAKK